MEYLTESPLYLVLFSGFLTLCFVIMYLQTHDKRVLPFLFGAIVLTVLPIVTDAMFKTDREQLRTTISRLAAAVRHNDLPAAAAFVHPEHPVVRDRINREMPTYDFNMCNITGFRKIEIDENDPSKATVDFTVFVNVKAPRYGHEGMASRGVTLEMRKLGEEWKISNYSHYQPISVGR